MEREGEQWREEGRGWRRRGKVEEKKEKMVGDGCRDREGERME